MVDPSWKNAGVAYVGIESIDLAGYSEKIASGGYFELELEQIAPPTLQKMLERARTVLTSVPTSALESVG